MNLPLPGGCRCGRLRFKITAAPLITMICHCNGCQRMTGSAFSLSALFAGDAFLVSAGEPVIGGLHGQLRHFFCPYCMSWVFTRPDEQDAFVNVRATMLDDASWFRPFMETCTKEKLPWVSTPAVRSFAGFPPQQDFGSLLNEFALRFAPSAT